MQIRGLIINNADSLLWRQDDWNDGFGRIIFLNRKKPVSLINEN